MLFNCTVPKVKKKKKKKETENSTPYLRLTELFIRQRRNFFSSVIRPFNLFNCTTFPFRTFPWPVSSGSFRVTLEDDMEEKSLTVARQINRVTRRQEDYNAFEYLFRPTITRFNYFRSRKKNFARKKSVSLIFLHSISFSAPIKVLNLLIRRYRIYRLFDISVIKRKEKRNF